MYLEINFNQNFAFVDQSEVGIVDSVVLRGGDVDKNVNLLVSSQIKIHFPNFIVDFQIVRFLKFNILWPFVFTYIFYRPSSCKLLSTLNNHVLGFLETLSIVYYLFFPCDLAGGEEELLGHPSRGQGKFLLPWALPNLLSLRFEQEELILPWTLFNCVLMLNFLFIWIKQELVILFSLR